MRAGTAAACTPRGAPWPGPAPWHFLGPLTRQWPSARVNSHPLGLHLTSNFWAPCALDRGPAAPSLSLAASKARTRRGGTPRGLGQLTATGCPPSGSGRRREGHDLITESLSAPNSAARDSRLAEPKALSSGGKVTCRRRRRATATQGPPWEAGGVDVNADGGAGQTTQKGRCWLLAGWPVVRALAAHARSPWGPMKVPLEGVLGVSGGVSPPKADNKAEGGVWARRETGHFAAAQRRDARAFPSAGGGGS